MVNKESQERKGTRGLSQDKGGGRQPASSSAKNTSTRPKSDNSVKGASLTDGESKLSKNESEVKVPVTETSGDGGSIQKTQKQDSEHTQKKTYEDGETTHEANNKSELE